MHRENDVRRGMPRERHVRWEPTPPSTPNPYSRNARGFIEIDTTEKTDAQLILEGAIANVQRDKGLLRGTRVSYYLEQINLVLDTVSPAYQSRIDEELAPLHRLMELYRGRSTTRNAEIIKFIQRNLPKLMDRTGRSAFEITAANIDNYVATTVRFLLLRALRTALSGQITERHKSRHGRCSTSSSGHRSA